MTPSGGGDSSNTGGNPLASFGIGVIGSVISGIGQEQAGQQQKAGFDYNAQVDLDNTANQIVSTEQKYSAYVGKQATAYASAGIDITKGSPLLMMAATAGRGGAEAAREYASGSEAASLQQYYGRLAAWRGTAAGIGSFLSGISGASSQYLKATGYSGGGGDGGDPFAPFAGNGGNVALN